MTDRHDYELRSEAAGGFLVLLFLIGTGAMIYGVIMLSGWAAVWVLLGYAAFLRIYMLIFWCVAFANGWGMIG